MKITQNAEKETVAMLVDAQHLGVRRIIPTSENIIGRKRENVMRTIKLICRCRMLLIKTICKILKYLLKLYYHQQQQHVVLIDPPASVSAPTTASSPTFGYRLIDMSISADIVMLLNCPGCHSIQCLKLCNINKKVWQDICSSVALFVYVATRFSRRSRLIYRRKTKEDKNFTMCMLELFMDEYKLVMAMNI